MCHLLAKKLSIFASLSLANLHCLNVSNKVKWAASLRLTPPPPCKKIITHLK